MQLLLIDADSARAADVESHLRHLGAAVHATRCEHVGALEPDAPIFDLCVISIDGVASLAAAGLANLRELGQRAPVLALGQPDFDCSLGAILAHGYADWVGIEDPLHLREAARREIEAAQARLQTAALREALLDSERRLEVLMHSTSDAHAIVIDGVHASANNPYLRALQLDPDSVTRTPYLDCIESSEREAVRDVLRSYSRGERSYQIHTHRFRQLDAKPQPIEVRYAPWIGDGERGVLISLCTPAQAGRDTPGHVRPARTSDGNARRDYTDRASRARLDPVDSERESEHQPGRDGPETHIDEHSPTTQTESEQAAIKAGGGLAAELDETQDMREQPLEESRGAQAPHIDSQTAAVAHEADTVAPRPSSDSETALRNQLRQSIRQNTLQLSMRPLRKVDDADEEEQVLVTLDPGTLLSSLEDGAAVRRVADRIGLSGALDRWQLFVASRKSAYGEDPHRLSRTRLHTAVCDAALNDDAFPGWLKQLAGQYPHLRHTLWLPLSAARRNSEATRRFRNALDAIGMRLCLTEAFHGAGDLTDLRDLKPHDVCLHSEVVAAWVAGHFSTENLQRLTSLLKTLDIQIICALAHSDLDDTNARRLGFCLVGQQDRDEAATSPTTQATDY